MQSLDHWMTTEVLLCVPYLTHTHTRIHTRAQLQGDIQRCEVVPGVFKTCHNNRQIGSIILAGPVGSSRWRLKVLPLGLTPCPSVPIGSTYPFGTSSGGLEGKASACNAGDLGSIPESGRLPWRRKLQPTPDSCLKNPMDGGAWEAAVHGISESDMTE